MVTAGGPYHSTLTASGKEIPVLERRTLITEDMTVEQHKGEETRYQNDHARHKEQEAHFRNLETQAGQDYKAEAASKTPNEARLKELAQTQECNRHRADESMHHALASQAGADYHKVKQVFVQDKRDEERHSPDPRRTLRLEENRGRLFGHSVQYRVHTSGAITKARLASSPDVRKYGRGLEDFALAAVQAPQKKCRQIGLGKILPFEREGKPTEYRALEIEL
ncbi:hypothetical protein FRC17_009857 [Serendipita sp. 399]|nr:hypothetical protein FRC17_009857 [Serendipita sp. 399]